MLQFTKMHGLGNDYVYMDAINQKIENRSELAKFVSDRHFGIGSDGLILICPSEKADFRIWIRSRNVRKWNKMCWEICV